LISLYYRRKKVKFANILKIIEMHLDCSNEKCQLVMNDDYSGIVE